ncbi:MAG: DUF4837 family protein [Bacteroidales bacterium]|nr:DUF4837 family protein [Bacteroidales bacterium]
MKRIALIIMVAAALCSCGRRSGKMLPSVSGKAGEILVVIEKTDWEGAVGNATRELLARDCPWFIMREPLYSLSNVTHGGFADLFKVHRNIIAFDIDPLVAEPGVKYMKDVWASPQALIKIAAPDAQEAVSMLEKNGKEIVAYIEQAERDRVIRNTLRYEVKDLAVMVDGIFGGSLHFPTGYQFKKKTEDFIWIADEKQYTIQGIFVYRYPALGDKADFSVNNIIAHRNETLRNNVPGMFENTYMTTGEIPTPTVEFLKYQGRSFAQTRGYWEVENDYMGGPFVSHSFYSPDGKYVVVCDAFVYAPKYDKRQYLRQVESILYSWEWNQKSGEKELRN